MTGITHLGSFKFGVHYIVLLFQSNDIARYTRTSLKKQLPR